MEDHMPRQSVFMSELTMPDVDEYLRDGDLVLVPTGSTEQHGPHSPLSTDVIIPTEVCRRVAERLHALVAPPVNYGISAGHRGFKALAYVSVPTFMAVIEDLGVLARRSRLSADCLHQRPLHELLPGEHGLHERVGPAARRDPRLGRLVLGNTSA